jgi:hypothetical protein
VTRSRVKLCAIAKDEGAYLTDWVHHHLHFGFDAVEVWVNGTSDPSVRILERIAAEHPHVSVRRVDKLLQKCLEERLSFQQVAYQRLAKKARREGFDFAAFLDLDEYWVPKDCRTPIGHFLPRDPDVKVVSFQWFFDVPDPRRAEFAPLPTQRTLLQADWHVKSVVRLDGTHMQVLPHTARVSEGVRTLVGEAFPMVDEIVQHYGSHLPLDYVRDRADEVPEAFVLHATKRSEREYLARLSSGLRQTGRPSEIKTNRQGYLPTDMPIVAWQPPRRALRRLESGRTRWRKAVGARQLVRRSQARLLERGEDFRTLLLTDSRAMAQARLALRGVSLPELDEAYPGWRDQMTRASIDTIAVEQDFATVRGWAYDLAGHGQVELALLRVDDVLAPAPEVRFFPRPDVRTVHPDAPDMCGFELRADVDRSQLESLELGVRANGGLWDRLPLSGVPLSST